MSDRSELRRLSRRAFLVGGAGAATVATLRFTAPHETKAPRASLSRAALTDAKVPDIHLAGTDGWVSIAASDSASLAKMDANTLTNISPFWPDPLADHSVSSHADGANLYVFGFRDVTGMTDSEVKDQRGRAQISAPQLQFKEGREYRVQLSNLGLSQRPDLVDGHTIHWHGFVNAIPLFDGVPELSLSVPIGRSFTYFYRPFDAGTYMYHCHFEDVEHVQMGMTGLLFVSPAQNEGLKRNPNYDPAKYDKADPTTFEYIDSGLPKGKYAYNDGVAPGSSRSTAYDREFGLFLTEIFAEGHYRDAHIQTTDWTDFKASFWCINGRTYPDTIAEADPESDERNADNTGPARVFDPGPTVDATRGGRGGALQYQPLNALIRCNGGDRVLLRFANLGYQSHVMTVDNITLTTIAKDASLLARFLPGNSAETNSGESIDVLFTAPAYDGTLEVRSDSSGNYNVYPLYERNYAYASNAGDPNTTGGMVTEIRVYQNALPAQPYANA